MRAPFGLGLAKPMSPAKEAESLPEIGQLLLSYSGPEPERVRRAIVKLAKGDPEKAADYLERARTDYRDVLWWADVQEEEDRKKQLFAGLNVADRLTFLKLSEDWTNAVFRGDRQGALMLLKKCGLGEREARGVIEGHFKI